VRETDGTEREQQQDTQRPANDSEQFSHTGFLIIPQSAFHVAVGCIGPLGTIYYA
jgi:hypothetical protein